MSLPSVGISSSQLEAVVTLGDSREQKKQAKLLSDNQLLWRASLQPFIIIVSKLPSIAMSMASSTLESLPAFGDSGEDKLQQHP